MNALQVIYHKTISAPDNCKRHIYIGPVLEYGVGLTAIPMLELKGTAPILAHQASGAARYEGKRAMLIRNIGLLSRAIFDPVDNTVLLFFVIHLRRKSPEVEFRVFAISIPA